MANLRSLFFERWTKFTECKGKKKRPSTHLTDIDTIDRSGTSMLTNSKGLNPIYLKNGKEKRLVIHMTGIDDIDKYVTFIAHQRLPSSLLFFPSLYKQIKQPP
jgi:hypothetical protein